MVKKPHNLKSLDVSGQKLDFNQFAQELSRAEYSLGLLQGSQKKLHNPTLLVSPLTAKEAATSSRIEGTQSDVSDVFVFEAGGEAKYDDIREVVNYRHAINLATAELKKGREISSHLIESLHEVLLKNVRHQGTPGKFREGQVWIAEKFGDPIEKALYVPPEPLHVRSLIENLVKYINEGNDNALIKAGIAHYQFEATHPFDDGNGRIGRLLIPIVLHQHQRLSSPILYVSGYFERNKGAYIDALHAVDEGGRYEEWLKFYLNAVAEQLKETQEIVDKIYHLYDAVREEFEETKSPYMIPFIDFIFASPVFSIQQVQSGINSATRHTARAMIRELQKRGRIKEIGTRKKAKLFVFADLLDILE